MKYSNAKSPDYPDCRTRPVRVSITKEAYGEILKNKLCFQKNNFHFFRILCFKFMFLKSLDFGNDAGFLRF